MTISTRITVCLMTLLTISTRCNDTVIADDATTGNNAQPENSPGKPALDGFDMAAFTKRQQQVIVATTATIEQSPASVMPYSRRGDAQFFLGRFASAVADYEKMRELQPELDISHWRLGIAYYYAGQAEKGVRQFENYHSFDNVDRENGIWRYFSQMKAYGQERARTGLLKYKKDDRAPFPLLYQMFSGEVTGEEIMTAINERKLSAEEDEKQRFYAHLYIGLNSAYTGDEISALRHLKQSVANRWGLRAGYGPNYMWHVGRLQLELLQKSARIAEPKPGTTKNAPKSKDAGQP